MRRGHVSRLRASSRRGRSAMSQIITCGMPLSKRFQAGDATVDVIRVVNTEVGAGEDLLRVIGINDDRIHRNVRQIAALVRPGERAAVRSTGYLEHVARRARRVGVKAANSRIANRHVHRWHR